MEEEEEEEREEVLSKGEQMMTVSCHDGLACFLGSSAPSRLPCLSDTFKSRERAADGFTGTRGERAKDDSVIPLSLLSLLLVAFGASAACDRARMTVGVGWTN